MGMLFDLRQIHRSKIAKEIIKDRSNNLTIRKVFPELLYYNPKMEIISMSNNRLDNLIMVHPCYGLSCWHPK